MRRDLLLWLAESHRNFHLAGPGLSESISKELRTEEPWLHDVAYESFPLNYEPRSLAKSPDGRKIVVGTKAGFLHLVSWYQNRWHGGVKWDLGSEPHWQGEKITRSIRAVRFLDNDTLVAGWGEGVFGIFNADSLACRQIVRATTDKQDNVGRAREQEWLGRFARFISLVPPSPPFHTHSAVMLGVTIGSQVHILYCDGDIYSAKTYLPEEILPAWGAGTRVVDGVWSHNFLWVLDSSGHIYRYAPADPEDSDFKIPLTLAQPIGTNNPGEERSTKGIFLLDHPREIGEFRAIASCVMGLAVLTSDDITFLRFNLPSSGADVPYLEPATARWVAVPNAIDCSVCLPFCSYYLDGPLASQPISRDNPVWTIVGTSQSGLRWISWHDPKGSLSGRLPAVSHAHRAGAGDSSVLQVRFVFHGRLGPTYVVCATRDHHLRIATLLDRKETEEILKKEIPQALEGDSTLQQESGIAWWLVLERIYSDFRPSLATSIGLGNEPRQLLSFTQREDLYRLIRWVLKQWRESALEAEEKIAMLQKWFCQILGRAYQIDQYLAQMLAKLAYDRIAQMCQNRGERGRQVEADLGLFAAFLSKWLVYGHTYGEKTNGLLQLYAWNKKSGHALDALTYLTKLLRRRVDPLWEARTVTVSPSSAIWDLVAPPSGEFSICSSTDGGISALSSQGEILNWELDDAVSDTLDNHCLEIFQGQLRHKLAEDFIKNYRHGPYARNLLLSRTSEDESGPYLLVFCLRGWRGEDQLDAEDKRARLYSILLQPKPAAIRIKAVESQVLADDLYGIYQLDNLTIRGRRHVLVAGTKGAWRSKDRWMVRPFIEFRVEIHNSKKLLLDLDQKIEVWSDRKGERSVFKGRLDYIGKEELLPETAHNPCWCFGSFTSPTGDLWLWAGFHDGQIRCFLRTKDLRDSLSWVQGGRLEGTFLGQDPHFMHEEVGLVASAPVWRLHILKEQQILAYGTADGVIGAFSLGKNEASNNSHRPHLAHYRESSPICGLLSYTDPEGGAKLLAITQGGIVLLIDFEMQDRNRRVRSLLSFPGSSLDRFALSREVRAATVVNYDSEPHNKLVSRSLPAILVGTSEGRVSKHVLALPRGSERRRIAFNTWCGELLEHREVKSIDGTRQPPPISLFVGKNVYDWLRVLDVRGVHLLRFSISWELRKVWPSDDVLRLSQVEDQEDFLLRLNELADDIYGRRPLTPEPAKVIWEEASRVANKVAELSLKMKEGEEKEALLSAFLRLATTVDDLCNRWIGSEQAVESRVLMHTFKCLFGWVGIILIGLARPSAKMLSVRRFLIHKIIQRRLGFNDRLVHLETVRNLNAAMMRAVREAGAQAQGSRWVLSLRPQPEASGQPGLYDLLTMVGDLGERHAGSLTPADPLWTELSRFFATSLLLLPQSSFVISQVVAESRLTERDTHFARAIQAQAEVILSQLAMIHTEEVNLALRQFEDSFDESIDNEIYRIRGIESERAKPVTSEAWRRLLKEAEEAEERLSSSPHDTFSNTSFLLDHAAAIRTTAYLIWLTNEEMLPERDRNWLEKSSHYFEHSRLYLNRLLEVWKKVRSDIRLAGDDPGGDRQDRGSIPAPISSALQLCDHEIAYLENTADLFEPQRAQYVKVINKWREQIWKRAEDAVDLLDILDKFNRHTYRASSDQLMSSISELAFQTAPLWLDLPGAIPLRSEIERRLISHPLVYAIFDSGNRLVTSTHLVGTLFAVARDYYRTPLAPASRQTTLKDIYGELAKFCGFEDLDLQVVGVMPEDISAPGTIAVWDTLLQELVINVKKYCSLSDRKFLVSCRIKKDRVELAFSGKRPFIECLHAEYKGELAESLPVSQRLGHLKKLVARTKEPGQRLAPLDDREENSSGMGLPLILRICRYLGMRADVTLLNPEITAQHRAGVASEEIMLGWPLCLKIDWE